MRAASAGRVCGRQPLLRQPEGMLAGGLGQIAPLFAIHSVAASACIRAARTSGAVARTPWRSKKRVSTPPAAKAGCSSAAIRKSRLLTTPATASSRSAAIRRRVASARVSPYAITLASIGS